MELQEYISEIVSRVTIEIAEEYKQRLGTNGKRATGGLINSVSPVTTVTAKQVEGALQLATYWRYVEGGGKGNVSEYPGAVYGPWKKYPPRDAILNWIKAKGIIPQGKTTEKSLAFLISRKIYEKGIQPYPCLAETIEGKREDVTDEVTRAVSRWGKEVVMEWFEGLTRESRYE